MKDKYIVICLVWLSAACSSGKNIVIKKYTAVNPVSYTDVAYLGLRDTVIVSTYSGRIAKRINGVPREIPVAHVGSEISSLAYNALTGIIAASTHEEGILLINKRNGKTWKTLKLISTWSNFIIFSEDFKYLSALDQKGNSHIWDASRGYAEMILPADFPKGVIRSIDKDQVATITSKKSVVLWNISTGKKIRESKINLHALADTDNNGMALSIDFNECHLYDMDNDRIVFSIKHPNWPLPNTGNPEQIFDIPFNMQLTTAKFAGEKIYTASIDRTLREWDRRTGKLLQTISVHKGTVNKIRVSKDGSQVVSVDLKGGINFFAVK